jgi:hypothetical protein
MCAASPNEACDVASCPSQKWYTVSLSQCEQKKAGKRYEDVQIADNDVHTCRRVVAGDTDVTTGLVTSLRELPHFPTFQGQVTPRNLHTGRRDCAHDEREKEGVAFLASRLEIRHEGGFVNTGS